MSRRWLLGDFNPLTVFVLLISVIYFWHLVFYIIYMFNFILLFPLPYGLWVLWLNIHTNWFRECTSCFYSTFDWHLACPTAECIHTVGRIIGVSIAAVASQGFTFMCQTTVNYVHSHEFLILFMISFEIIYSFENKTYLLHCVVFSSCISLS